MNKKLICLLLCFAFLVPALASCNKSSDALSDTATEASRYTTTLNVWLITEEGTDPAQAAAVNNAINKLTKAKFKTQLNIKYLTESEYYDAVEKAFADKKQAQEEEKKAKKAAQEAQKRGEAVTTTESATEEETFLNEYGIPELKYPVVPDYQVDILFLGSYEKYRQYADNEWLSSMDDEMQDYGGELAYYINSIFRDAAVYGGTTYAMPNNHAIGEYTFLAVDKELFARFGYTVETMENPSVLNAEFYDVLNKAYKNGITPIYSESGELDLGLVHYWNFTVDGPSGTAVQHPDVFSIYGSAYSNASKRGDQLGTGLIFRDAEYRQRLKRKAEYESTTGFITTDAEAKTAVKIVKGGYALKKQYEDQGYTVLTAQSPRATDEDVYGSMFAIGGYVTETNASRAMEIITYLNTNSEFRNLLQYGIENVNYVLNTYVDETDGKEYSYVTLTETNAYHMDINKTGNVFIAYPDSRENVKLWADYKKQNLEATTEPALGLYFSTDYKTDTDTIRVLNAVSAAVRNYMDANLGTLDSVNAFLSSFDAEATSNAKLARFLLSLAEGDIVYNAAGDVVTAKKLEDAIKAMRNSTLSEDDTTTPASPSALYNDWLTANGYNK